MGLFEQFPYTNFHGLNLKWILDRMVEFETRLTTAEGKISSLEDRMESAEDRLTTAEGDIDALEGRMDTAEADIDRLEMQVPGAEAGDAGKVLTATGSGTASWQDVPEELPATLGTAGQVLTVNNAASGVQWSDATIYVDYDANNPPDPEIYIPMIKRGQKVVLRYTTTAFTYYAGGIYAVEDRSNHKGIFIEDPTGQFCTTVGLLANDPHAFCSILWRKDSGVISFELSGVYNQNYYSPSYS